ncbi:hypothetical protein GGE66_005953 [Rhizobium leguminosarum]|uniref:Uncharacterized protein n=1 Tax=Rhizobium leguminosarum TaxID=384 RepID=A0A7X0A0B7_RHILE|nr:hypothetical protein [Rhizobium leguminosarum]MBB6224932.1 hypothetical protein [Rhizobium leguminosarum]
MKLKLTVLATAVILTVLFALPAGAQVVIHEDQGPAYSPDDDQVETDFLRRWNSHHDSRSWGSRSPNFGPDDAMPLLERPGYLVRDVKDVGERYLIREHGETATIFSSACLDAAKLWVSFTTNIDRRASLRGGKDAGRALASQGNRPDGGGTSNPVQFEGAMQLEYILPSRYEVIAPSMCFKRKN